MTTIIQENVNGARVVRAFANESYEFEKMDKALIIHNNAFITLGFVENYHKIAAKIEHNNRRNGSKVFAITSIVGQEGKSTTAANIAISLADRGHKVILIDADCKKPALFAMFEKKYSEKTGNISDKSCFKSPALFKPRFAQTRADSIPPTPPRRA